MASQVSAAASAAAGSLAMVIASGQIGEITPSSLAHAFFSHSQSPMAVSLSLLLPILYVWVLAGKRIMQPQRLQRLLEIEPFRFAFTAAPH